MALVNYLNPARNSLNGSAKSQLVVGNRKRMTFTGISVLTANVMCVTNLNICPRNPFKKDKRVHVAT